MAKPHKYYIKLFIVTGAFGFTYNLEVHVVKGSHDAINSSENSSKIKLEI